MYVEFSMFSNYNNIKKVVTWSYSTPQKNILGDDNMKKYRFTERVYDSINKDTVDRKLGIFREDEFYTNTIDIYRKQYGEYIDLNIYHHLYWSLHGEAEITTEYKYYLEDVSDPRDVFILLPLDWYAKE